MENCAASHALQVAIEMERLGQTFYESLAACCGDALIETLAKGLAGDEGKHIHTFGHMLAALSRDQRGSQLPEKELFAAAKEVRGKILPTPNEVRAAVFHSDIGKALDMAIEMESEAVSYYLGLASSLTGLDAALLTSIADEEKKHLRALEERAERTGQRK